MAEAGGARGDMDVREHKATFSLFMKITEWGTILVIATVALLTVAFAMGLGWFSGLLAFAVICIAAGMILGLGATYWAVIIGLLVLMAIGGGIVGLAFPAKAAALTLAVLAA